MTKTAGDYVDEVWEHLGRPVRTNEERRTYVAAIEAAVAEERDRCAAIARAGANSFRDKPIKFVAPEKYAADLADDIADAIECPTSEADHK